MSISSSVTSAIWVIRQEHHLKKTSSCKLCSEAIFHFHGKKFDASKNYLFWEFIVLWSHLLKHNWICRTNYAKRLLMFSNVTSKTSNVFSISFDQLSSFIVSSKIWPTFKLKVNVNFYSKEANKCFQFCQVYCFEFKWDFVLGFWPLFHLSTGLCFFDALHFLIFIWCNSISSKDWK